MGLELFIFAIVILIGCAVFDLIVGVSNDAVNFLNSSIGSRVAPRYVIMIMAGLGIMAGVTFSSGMMEVARKGIFHPHFFIMPELITIFLAVMLTDILLLDIFNTYGLPTSTTVSIVFELLGAAVAVSLIKIMQQGDSVATLSQYINTSKAMMIIFGILLSVVIAFICGAIVQFFTRILFTFDYVKRLKRFGAIWGGIALAFITYFILVKGAKGATFITPETAEWIKTHAFIMLVCIFVVSAIILQILLFLKFNILKPIVLIGTFALAMAFAANDLVNFIGVPMAGMHAYQAAIKTSSPLTVTMEALGQKVPTESYMLLVAGVIMVITLWISKKARTVTQTEISLGEQSEGEEKFESVFLSRLIVKGVINFFEFIKMIVPSVISSWIAKRLDTAQYKANIDTDKRPSFDLLRASVNLMVASIVISYATSQKLPLSTTYVTFMVAMGTSFADLAWGRESAVYRVTGVLTVISGWFMTALIAFTFSGLLAVIIFYGKAIGVIFILIAAAFIIWRNHHTHKERAEVSKMDDIFNLKKVTDSTESVSITFNHMGIFIREIRESLNTTINALFDQNIYVLRSENKKRKSIQRWANIIIANVYKSMRILQKKEEKDISFKYAQTFRRLQKLADGHHDIVTRAYQHVSNHHKGFLTDQMDELKEVNELLQNILLDVEIALCDKDLKKYENVVKKDKKLRSIAKKLNKDQIERIKNEKSKTRLSILFYAIVGNAMMLSKQNLKLMEIFSDSFGGTKKITKFDMD